MYMVPDDVLAAHLEGEAVLLHMESKRYYRLNETGAFIWRGLERGSEPEALVAELCEQFDVDAETAGAEFARLLDDLLGRGLLVATAAETPPDA